MESVKEEFKMFMKTFVDFEREVLVDVVKGENSLSSVLSVTDFRIEEPGAGADRQEECTEPGEDDALGKGTLTLAVMQRGLELEWEIHYDRMIREGSRFALEEECAGQVMFHFYELFSQEDPYWE